MTYFTTFHPRLFSIGYSEMIPVERERPCCNKIYNKLSNPETWKQQCNTDHKEQDVYTRDQPIYRYTDIIGRYLTFWLSTNIGIFTDILVCLSTAQFEPNLSWLSKNLRILQIYSTKIFMSCRHFLLISFMSCFALFAF